MTEWFSLSVDYSNTFDQVDIFMNYKFPNISSEGMQVPV